jgi:uncharacterized protein YjbI with pentapeptide repeats
MIDTYEDKYTKELRVDSEKCFGLCCVALYFSASEGFPTNKEAGKPCVNLKPDFTCSVHKSLIDNGLKGCTAYDCFGAGQKVAQVTLKGNANFRKLDYFGSDLRKTNLRGVDLRGACLIAVNLRDVDLSWADLIGADLRDANLSGTNLANSIFLTQAQINTAKGDSNTKLPTMIVRPSYWSK